MGGEWTAKVGTAADAEERQLELTLGLPGGERRSNNWAPVARVDVLKNIHDKGDEADGSSGLSLGLFTKCPKSICVASAGGRRGFADTVVAVVEEPQQQTKEVDGPQHWLGSRWPSAGDVGKACASTPSAAASVAPSADTAVARNRSQARTPAAPVVGWPPIRSFRKNMATSSRLAHPSKAASAAADQPEKPPSEGRSSCATKGVFVKINMDGIPIGRKVDLKSCQGYDTLSSAVDKLFRGLLMAAQKAPPAAAAAASASNGDAEERPVITGLLDGTGEYTLVYEDEEGDRILVGDVPWEMFITTAKRLRVLRTSELSKLSLGATSRKRAAPDQPGVC